MESPKHELTEATDYLFNCDFSNENFDPDGAQVHLELAERLIGNYPWNEVFEAWNSFLRNKCKTTKQVINFCNLFYYYGGQDHVIPNPYDFVGYLLYMIDIDKNWEEAGDLFDSLCVTVLEKSGFVSLVKDPYYQVWRDPRALAVAESYRKQNSEAN